MDCACLVVLLILKDYAILYINVCNKDSGFLVNSMFVNAFFLNSSCLSDISELYKTWRHGDVWDHTRCLTRNKKGKEGKREAWEGKRE